MSLSWYPRDKRTASILPPSFIQTIKTRYRQTSNNGTKAFACVTSTWTDVGEFRRQRVLGGAGAAGEVAGMGGVTVGEAHSKNVYGVMGGAAHSKHVAGVDVVTGGAAYSKHAAGVDGVKA
uniref:Uncharacterized protein n=1 Tax=Glossina austeni TaxID=7395 RepID=A0A1A9V651_GLOAU